MGGLNLPRLTRFSALLPNKTGEVEDLAVSSITPYLCTPLAIKDGLSLSRFVKAREPPPFLVLEMLLPRLLALSNHLHILRT